MAEITNKKPYDLGDRTFTFAREVILFIKSLPKEYLQS